MAIDYNRTFITLPHGLPRVECLHFDTIHSTMQAIDDLPWHTAKHAPRVAVAEYQTAGRGQQGTFWESAHGENLLFTLSISPQRVAATAQYALSIISALAAWACCAPLINQEALTMKWPNDLYYHDSKLAGTLIQHTLSGQYLCTTHVGVGLNVNQTHFESNAPNPISLRNITTHIHDKSALLQSYLTVFLTHLAQLEAHADYADTLWDSYHTHLYRRQGLHTYMAHGEVFLAEIIHIDRLGRLHLRHTNGTQHAYTFKEITAVLPSH